MTVAEFVAESRYKTDRSSPRRWVLSHALRYWWLIPIVLIGAFGNAALAGAIPMLVGRAFDAINSSQPDLAAARTVAMLIVGSQLLRAALQLARNFGSELIGQRLERDARDELYAALLGKSMSFHTLQPVGDTMARATNDVREINLMLNPGFNLVIGSANFLLMPVLFAPRYSPWLVIPPLAFIVAYVWALRRYLRTLQPITQEARTAFGRLNARLTESIDGVEVVKSGAQEPAEVERFTANASAYRKAFVAQGDEEAKFLPLLLLGLTIGFGFVMALLLFRTGKLTVGDVVAYMGLLNLFSFPTFVSLWAYSQVSLGLASAARILELANRETELDENRDGHSAAVRGAIEFDHVDMSYVDGKNVLSDVSVRLEPGQTLALVGETGSGKTTMARLINRTYDVDDGAVRVDGVDVRDWNLESLRRQVSTIEQDVFLFSRSIADNIAFGRPDATREEIEQAAKDAQADGFIAALPDGYDTVIGERGVTLSGGQRQRLAIARALLTDPRILVLDDATSAIDSATEDEIQKAISRAATGRTMVLITHRLSQIRRADLIVVLKGGAIDDMGTHDELMERSPAYRRIFARLRDQNQPATRGAANPAEAGG
jgi:ATP-binding cassette subfamily B protein